MDDTSKQTSLSGFSTGSISSLSQLLGKSPIESLIAGYGLPLHIYFTEEVRRAASKFRAAADRLYPNCDILFAVKSNPCRGAIRTAHHFGCGADVVSEFELRAALEEGINPLCIVCNGNAKSDEYIKLAVASGTYIAADSREELRLISAETTKQRRTTRVLLRLSGMALDGLTAPEQSTAASWTKFGEPVSCAEEFYNLAESLPGVQPVGFSAHIGTQICDVRGYELLAEILVDITRRFVKAGCRLEALDFGGGYPLAYLGEEEWKDLTARLRRQLRGESKPGEAVTFGESAMGYGWIKERPPSDDDPYRGKAYWSEAPGERMLERLLSCRIEGRKTIAEELKELGEPRLFIEPGRGLFGPAGVTLAKISGVKSVEGNTLVIADIGIVNHGTVLVTPDVYPFMVWPPREDDHPVEVFIGGRLCFTGDMISKIKIPLNRLPKRGELLVVGLTGAYCADHFASNSCGFPRPAKIAVKADGDIEVWRPAETYRSIA